MVSGTPIARSPYEAVLGGALDGLHPRLRQYFGAIPAGQHGFGRGTFAVVGTPRRLLWPVLRVLARQGVLFPVWERDVPFTIVNRPTVDARGHVAVAAVRSFHFQEGDRRMVDAITAESHGLVDYLGVGRRYGAVLEAEVCDGTLRLRSTRITVRVGSHHICVPRRIAPQVTLTERFDDATGTQQVAVAVDAPLLGRLYEYTGSFIYEIRPGEASA